jgi:hypothetical protein
VGLSSAVIDSSGSRYQSLVSTGIEDETFNNLKLPDLKYAFDAGKNSSASEIE